MALHLIPDEPGHQAGPCCRCAPQHVSRVVDGHGRMVYAHRPGAPTPDHRPGPDTAPDVPDMGSQPAPDMGDR